MSFLNGLGLAVLFAGMYWLGYDQGFHAGHAAGWKRALELFREQVGV
jgi:hypothetical protein